MRKREENIFRIRAAAAPDLDRSALATSANGNRLKSPIYARCCRSQFRIGKDREAI